MLNKLLDGFEGKLKYKLYSERHNGISLIIDLVPKLHKKC